MRATDGPAAGLALMLRSSPTWLRLVVRPRRLDDRKGAGRYLDENLDHRYAGQVVVWDALDAPDDTPEANELVEAYRIIPGTWSQVFLRPGGRYTMGDYAHRPADRELLDGPLRHTIGWRAWAVLQTAAETQAGGITLQAGADLARLDQAAFLSGLELIHATEHQGLWKLPARVDQETT